MKVAVLVIAACLTCETASAITQAELISRTRGLLTKQKEELDQTTGKLQQANQTTGTLITDLTTKQKAIDDLGVERDTAVAGKASAEKQRDEVLKRLHRYKFIMSGLVTALVVFVCLKLGLPINVLPWAIGAGLIIGNGLVWWLT